MSTMPIESKLDFKALQANRNITARNYWRNRLAGYTYADCFENTCLITSSAGNKVYTERKFPAPGQVYKYLSGIAASGKAKQVVLLATLGVWVQKYFSLDDTMIFTPMYAGSPTQETGGNLIPVRMKNFAEKNFTSFLTSLKENLLQDIHYANYPVENIVNRKDGEFKKLPVIGMQLEEVQQPWFPGTIVPGILFSFSVKEILSLTIIYDTGRFDESYLEKTAGHYFGLLENLINNRDAPISTIEITTAEERNNLLFKNNPAASAFPVPLTASVSNVRVYVLNRYLQPLPAGVNGYLYIPGNGLTIEDLLKLNEWQKPVENPYVKGEKIYNTGWLASIHSDGTVVYKGRAVNTAAKELITTNGEKTVEYKPVNGATANRKPTIPLAEKREYYPISFAQRRFIYSQQMFKVGTSYNSTVVYSIEGEISYREMEAAFLHLINRHEVFRTSFHFVDGILVQKINETAPLDIIYKDFSNITGEEELEKMVRREIDAFIKPFDLTKPPLFKVGLLAIPGDKWVLLFDIDHSINDGASQGIIIREFLGLLDGKELKQTTVQYKDFTVWENRYFQSKEFTAKKQYWLDVFKTIPPPINVPTDYPRSDQTGYAANEYSSDLSVELTEKLIKLSADKCVTIYILMLATLKVLLFKLTRQTDICIGIPFSQRNNTQLEEMMGLLLNTLVLRTYPGGKKTFSAFLKEVREVATKAYANCDYPFEMLLQDIGYKRVEGRNPLFDVLLNSQNVNNDGRLAKEQGSGRSDNLKFLPYTIEGDSTPFDLLIFLELRETDISLKLHYKTALFEKPTIRYFMDEYTSLLEQVVINQDLPLDEYAVFAAAIKKSNRIKIVNNKQ